MTRTVATLIEVEFDEQIRFSARVAELRRGRGLSQRDLATQVHRSESWVSQVERGVQPVERLSVLQQLADALGVSVRQLRPDAAAPSVDTGPRNDLNGLRTILTGHPALPALFTTRRRPRHVDVSHLERTVEQVWQLAHASRFVDLTTVLADFLPQIEEAVRVADDEVRPGIHRLRARTYQAVAAAFARQGEADAAWLAADRAITAAEQSGHPLDVIAGHFRMAHAFIGLQRHDQAEQVAEAAVGVLSPRVQHQKPPPEELSLYGALHLVLAVVTAREGNRAAARQHIAEARAAAERLGVDRNDFNTEFGPTNVSLHAVSVAVDLGDAGEALDLASAVDPSGLSPERQARFLIDVAQAHTQRRHVGEATQALLTAEQHSAEMVQGHPRARETIRELVQLSGRRAPAELVNLAE